MKKIAILGSTRIYWNTDTGCGPAQMEILRFLASAQGKIFPKLEEQVRKFRPRLVAVWDEKAAKELAKKIADSGYEVLFRVWTACWSWQLCRIQRFW